LKVSKYGAGEGWRPVCPIVRKMKKCYAESMKKGTSCIQYKEGRPTLLVASCIVNAFYKTRCCRKDIRDRKTRKKK
jgi:hypothetical protein